MTPKATARLGLGASLPLAAAALSAPGPVAAQQVDPTLLNIQSQGGQVVSINASSRIFDTDDPTEAVGNPTGPVEPGTFIFADNGNGGTESLSMNLDFPGVTLTGVRITGGGGGAAVGDPRTISTVLVAGSIGTQPTRTLGQIDDFNDAAGFHDILFNAPEAVDQLIIQFGTPEQGARVTEIDAIVPEPGAVALLTVGAAGLFIPRRRRGI